MRQPFGSYPKLLPIIMSQMMNLKRKRPYVAGNIQPRTVKVPGCLDEDFYAFFFCTQIG